jgi:hypothetical protein
VLAALGCAGAAFSANLAVVLAALGGVSLEGVLEVAGPLQRALEMPWGPWMLALLCNAWRLPVLPVPAHRWAGQPQVVKGDSQTTPTSW